MKILIVNTFYYPNMQGGAEQSVKLLAEGLVEQGNEVGVYCVDAKDGSNEDCEYNGVHIFRRSTHKFNLYRFSYNKKKVGKIEKVTQKLISTYNSEVVKEFKEFCVSYRPDIIHTNTIYGISGFIWKAAHDLNIPVIHTVRDIGIVSPVQYGHKASCLVREFHRIKTLYTTKFPEGVTAPSQYTLRTSLETGAFKNAKIKKCIFNSVKFDINDVIEIIKEKESRSDKSPVKFMYAGRLIYFKGIKNMIEAFEHLDNRNCELHICGTGELAGYVSDCAKKDTRIIFCGKLDNQKLAEKYKECDVLLFPSVWPEPFGRVFIEGNMYGMPVIAGNCGGIPEINAVTHGGELCDCNDVEQLSLLMKKFLNRNIYKEYFENIIRNISAFNIDIQIREYEKIYNLLISGKFANEYEN